MYIVRETFIAKPGYAGKLARMMKEEMKKMKDFKGYVLLDAITDYNKIVIEFELESLAEFEKEMQKMDKQKMENKSDTPPEYTQYYLKGRREIFKIL